MNKAAGPNTLALVGPAWAELQKLHYNRCPQCGAELHEFEFRNVTLQRCASCQGSFLSAAELEKLERSRALDSGLLRTLVADVLRLFEHKHSL